MREADSGEGVNEVYEGVPVAVPVPEAFREPVGVVETDAVPEGAGVGVLLGLSDGVRVDGVTLAEPVGVWVPNEPVREGEDGVALGVKVGVAALDKVLDRDVLRDAEREGVEVEEA